MFHICSIYFIYTDIFHLKSSLPWSRPFTSHAQIFLYDVNIVLRALIILLVGELSDIIAPFFRSGGSGGPVNEPPAPSENTIFPFVAEDEPRREGGQETHIPQLASFRLTGSTLSSDVVKKDLEGFFLSIVFFI